MNEKIEQCKADITKLQEELRRLEDEAKLKPRHGDIVRYRLVNQIRLIVLTEAKDFRAYNAAGCEVNNSYSPDSVADYYANGRYIVIGNVFDREAE